MVWKAKNVFHKRRRNSVSFFPRFSAFLLSGLFFLSSSPVYSLPPARALETVVVANRFPAILKITTEGPMVQHNPIGGLARALGNLQQQGVPITILGSTGGIEVPIHLRPEVQRLLAEINIRPIFTGPAEYREFYEVVANGALWPVDHGKSTIRYFRRPSTEAWQLYQKVNRRFSENVIQQINSGIRPVVWVHDYQLMLVGKELRTALVEGRIKPTGYSNADYRSAYFHHIPWPDVETLMLLPQWREITEALLAFDIVGFHTAEYLNNFRTTLNALKIPNDGRTAFFKGREIHLDIYPIGIHPSDFGIDVLRRPGVEATYRAIREAHEGQTIIFGGDRIDYTKGIPERLMAFESLLERRPDLVGKLVFVQVCDPSRQNIKAYRRLRQEIQKLASEINEEFGRPGYMPVDLRDRMETDELVSMYAAADITLLNPWKDGMNLMALEATESSFAANRLFDADPGVLIVSRQMGAANQLPGALKVDMDNFSPERLADTIETALAMPRAERIARVKANRGVVVNHTVDRWAESILFDLHLGPRNSTKIFHLLQQAPYLRSEAQSSTKRLLLVSEKASAALTELDRIRSQEQLLDFTVEVVGEHNLERVLFEVEKNSSRFVMAIGEKSSALATRFQDLRKRNVWTFGYRREEVTGSKAEYLLREEDVPVLLQHVFGPKDLSARVLTLNFEVN